MILLLALLLAACGELPVEPVEEATDALPGWCSPYAAQLEGQWEREFRARGHDFASHLVLAQVEPCVFAYSVDVVQAPHADQEGMKVYQTNGRIVTSDYEAVGPVQSFTIDTYRTFEENYGDHGASVRTTSDVIYDTEELTLWGDSLKLWGNTYQRTEQ